MIVGVIERLKDKRVDDKAIGMDERMNEMSEWEETVEAMQQMEDSASGKDVMSRGYIQTACDDVQVRVIEIVRMNFDVRVNEWADCSMRGIIFPSLQKD